MMDDSYSEASALAERIAREAGKLLLDNLDTGFFISKKGRINLVTEMDLKSEKLITSRIKDRFPQHEILAEEGGAQGSPAPFRWIIDPLDGTTNYAHGYRFFSVSIALEAYGRTVVGVVYDPVTDELFRAEAGKGAFLNGSPIQVSSEQSVEDSMLSTGFSYSPEAMQANLALFNRLIPKARAIRRDGSAALDLCYTACGRFDGFWEISLSAWDVAAGKLIVEEAGGRATLFDGRPCSIHDEEILASNGRIHEDLGKILCEPASPNS